MNDPETDNHNSEVAPNQTVYISNLNEKVKLDELKQSLYYLCSQYGEIVDIVAKKNIRMRGQAFIIYKDINSATNALKGLQNFNFFDKNMKVSFAKQRSDAVAKMEGTFVPREKPKMKLEDLKPANKKKQKMDVESQNQLKPQKEQRPAAKTNIIVPNNILFVENLPAAANQEMLTALFSQYIGFREVRLIATKNVAFVEYDDELQAGIALSGLHGFKMTADSPLQISYAKK